jgi:hypothetical protein|tara:strand:+ start:496 stop:711 length:216 start_codon:yes stop_codon:yes gene_type:complete
MIKLSKIEGQDKIISRAKQIVRESWNVDPNRVFTYMEALGIAEEEYALEIRVFTYMEALDKTEEEYKDGSE